MPSKRTGYAPWSLTREAGVLSATVDGTIEVPQSVQPTIDTGFCDEKGNWVGVKSSDNEFRDFTKHLAIPNGETVLAPATANVDHINMTGFSSIFFAIKPSNAGNYSLDAVMGPDTSKFANLSPIVAATALRGLFTSRSGDDSLYPLFDDDAESLTANKWNIFYIQDRLKDQKLMQLMVGNNSGGDSDIEITYMRLV